MTQVPWLGLTPRSPAIAGKDTLAIEVSSTFMKVAADSASVPHMRADPVSGAGSARGAGAGGVSGGSPEDGDKVSEAIYAWNKGGKKTAQRVGGH